MYIEKHNCPYCNCNLISKIKKPIIITVRGEEIEATEEYLKCEQCKEEFEYMEGHDYLDEAYREYRRRHNMLQPEQITNWRENLELSIIDVSKLLGWKDIRVLSLYEHGALQSRDEDIQLKNVMQPNLLIKLLELKGDFLGKHKLSVLTKKISMQNH